MECFHRSLVSTNGFSTDVPGEREAWSMTGTVEVVFTAVELERGEAEIALRLSSALAVFSLA